MTLLKMYSILTRQLVSVRTLFASIIKEPKVALGRWDPAKCLKQQERVLYYANMDHCGDCGKLVIENKNIHK